MPSTFVHQERCRTPTSGRRDHSADEAGPGLVGADARRQLGSANAATDNVGAGIGRPRPAPTPTEAWQDRRPTAHAATPSRDRARRHRQRPRRARADCVHPPAWPRPMSTTPPPTMISAGMTARKRGNGDRHRRDRMDAAPTERPPPQRRAHSQAMHAPMTATSTSQTGRPRKAGPAPPAGQDQRRDDLRAQRARRQRAAPYRRSRRWNSRIASSRSSLVKSGHRRSMNTSSA